MSRIPLRDVALIVAAVVVVAFAGYVMTRDPGAATTSDADAPPPPPGAPTSSAEPERPVIAFIGDSYTAGIGAEAGTPKEAKRESYAGLVTEALGADMVNLGEGGTGYLNPGQADERETVYLPRAEGLRGSPDVIVVQGGGNDQYAADYENDEQAAVSAVLSTLRDNHPDAQLLVLGPFLPPTSNADAIAALTATIEAAADAEGVEFVDGRRWLAERSLVIRDGVHPNPKGHQRIAELLEPELEPLLAE